MDNRPDYDDIILVRSEVTWRGREAGYCLGCIVEPQPPTVQTRQDATVLEQEAFLFNMSWEEGHEISDPAFVRYLLSVHDIKLCLKCAP
jgi:hypothetical protein